jgi:tetratricopeptide (TPR) repeat protein
VVRRAYNNRGLVYSTLGEYQRAIQDHNEAIRLDPQLAEAYYPRGVAYGALGEYQRAIEDLDEAIRLDPQDAKAYNNRGRAYDDLGEHERAIQDHNEAIRLDPQLASAYNNRGLAYDGLGEHQRAIEDLTQQEAENTVIERDKTRAHYFRRFFGVDDPDKPESYHLVINTSDVAADYAVDLVVQAAKVVEAGKFRTADSVG